jgi:hypothetical protein
VHDADELGHLSNHNVPVKGYAVCALLRRAFPAAAFAGALHLPDRTTTTTTRLLHQLPIRYPGSCQYKYQAYTPLSILQVSISLLSLSISSSPNINKLAEHTYLSPISLNPTRTARIRNSKMSSTSAVGPRRKLVGTSLKMYFDLTKTLTYAADLASISSLAANNNIDLFIIPD